MIPNFFLVGAPKAGTTSLYHYLGQHPQIYLSPIKEPCFFADEIRPKNFSEAVRPRLMRELEETEAFLAGPMLEKRNGGFVVDWGGYLTLFAGACGQPAVGEGSINYLWSPTAPHNIAAHIPGARILMLLRDPASRAYSQYLHGVTNGLIGVSFRRHLERSLHHGPLFDDAHPFLEFGQYHQQVTRYLEFFPRTQVFIRLYEDFRDRQPQTLREVFEFLGVDPGVKIDASVRHREPRVPRHLRFGYLLKRSGIWEAGSQRLPRRWRNAVSAALLRPRHQLQMDAEDRAFLVAYYRDDIEKLAALIGRDLSAWLR